MVALLGVLAIAGCSADPATPGAEPVDKGDTPTTSTPRPTASPDSAPATPRGPGPASGDGTLTRAAYGAGSEPPPWLYTRELPETADGYGEVRPTPEVLRRRAFTMPDQVPMLPGRGYASRVVSPAPADVVDRSTWEPGCPVARDELAWLRLTFWGFDAQRHTGELLVHTSAATDLDQVFRRLWEARFPMEQVVIVRSIDEEAPPTGDGNGTGSFVCRATTGGTSFSQHAYGLAIDVNTFQNPYQNDGLVLPELASSYLAARAGAAGDDHRRRPGGRGVPRDRLVLGRRVEHLEGLSALQCERPLSDR